ncbi:unnamed protein product, partial [Polarella glacialis]
EWLGGEAELIGSEPFCLSGCIAALWLVGTAEQDWGGGNAVFLLQLARIMLGVLAPWSSSKPYRWGDAFVPALGRWGGWERPTAEEVCQELPFDADGDCPHWARNTVGGCKASEDSQSVPQFVVDDLKTWHEDYVSENTSEAEGVPGSRNSNNKNDNNINNNDKTVPQVPASMNADLTPVAPASWLKYR